MRQKYASKLTKKFLELNGITEITKDARVFKGEKEIFPYWLGNPSTDPYLGIILYERDEEGHLLKSGKTRVYRYTRADGSIGESESWTAIQRVFGLHRLMWAWHYGEVPEGMVVDHIDNKHNCLYDYRLENLQLLTQAENLAKERDYTNTREIKCNLNKPRSFYEEKLIFYLEEYEKAKANHDAEMAHRLRTNIAGTKARLRYYDSHISEANELLQQKENEAKAKADKLQDRKDLEMIRALKKQYKQEGDKFMWHQLAQIEKNWNKYTKELKEEIIKAILKK